MKRRNLYRLLIAFSGFSIFGIGTALGQTTPDVLTGKVTFATSNSVYVRFDNTERIKVGDTLQLNTDKGRSSCLVVTNKSSISCVCRRIANCDVIKDDELSFRVPGNAVKKEVDKTKSTTSPQIDSPYQQRMRGSISAATYINNTTSGTTNRRDMYRFSLNASNINNSKFSTENYFIYRHNSSTSESSSYKKKDLFNVYSLAVKYDIDSTFSITMGRKVNSKASSLGMIDGLQMEKSFGNIQVGILSGFRPDITDHSFNSQRLQFGTYLGVKTETRKFYSQSTIGFLEERNGGNIDRRYIYLQHSSTISSNFNIFSSLELDVFNNFGNAIANNLRLTNFHISTRFRVNRKLNFRLSFDTRKRILYYETFRTEIEELLADDRSRQGIRFRVNFRPTRLMNLGLTYGKRFQSDNQNQSDNINGFFSLSKLPSIGGRLTTNINVNRSHYLVSGVISIRHSKDLIKKKLRSDIYVRNVQYAYIVRETQFNQQYYGASLTYNILPKLTFTALGEMAMKPPQNTYRINARIIKRF